MSETTSTPTPTEPHHDVREQHQIVSVGRGDLPGGVYVKCRCDEHVLIPAAAYTDHVLAAVSAAAPDERELGVAADLIEWLADARDEYASAGGPYADAIHQETALARTLAKALRNPEDAWGWLPTWMAPEYEARHAAALAARPAPVVSGEAPTTEQVRRAWTDWHDLTGANSPEEFDRWLAEHDAQERASALADAANDDRWHRVEHGHVRAWLRARADALTVADAPAADDEGAQA